MASRFYHVVKTILLAILTILAIMYFYQFRNLFARPKGGNALNQGQTSESGIRPSIFLQPSQTEQTRLEQLQQQQLLQQRHQEEVQQKLRQLEQQFQQLLQLHQQLQAQPQQSNILSQQQLKQTSVPQRVTVHGQTVLLHAHVRVVDSNPPVNSALNPRICVPLPQSPKSATICIYDQKEDAYVSGDIQQGHLWENGLVLHMVSVLQSDPNMQLVDLGSNIGIYTLMAAALGRYTLAVDFLDKNILLLQNSLQISNFSHLVTLVKNAVYKDRVTSLGFKTYKGNVGGTYIDENSEHSGSISTICLDDLVPLVRAKNVFLKMDIENSEHHALACAHEFFTNLNVKFIQMEWHSKTAEATNQIQAFITRYNYSPKLLSGSQLVPCTISTTLPNGDVFFVKQ